MSKRISDLAHGKKRLETPVLEFSQTRYVLHKLFLLTIITKPVNKIQYFQKMFFFKFYYNNYVLPYEFIKTRTN